jgi:DNA-binding SARP family transcriptional activator
MDAQQTGVLPPPRPRLDVLDAQNTAFEALGDYERAVAAARLQLKLEPWLEEAHRRCMRGLALAGRRDAALHQYNACCRALQAELGVEPAASTQELCAAIRAGKQLAAPRSAVAAPRGAASGPRPA